MAKATAKKKAAAKTTSVANGTKRYTYEKRDAKTPTGRVVTDCGDSIAVALRGKTLAEVLTICRKNKVEVNKAWENIHPGRGKMAASNVLRGMVRRKEEVTIDGKVIKSL